MKISVILFLTFLMSSCDSFDDPNGSNAVLSNSNTKQENVYDDLFKKNKLEEIEKERNGLKKYVGEMSKTERLSVLKDAKFIGNDLEIRIRKQSAWWKTWLFVLKRADNKWSAEYQKQIFYDGTKKVKSASRRKLSEPKSGWEIFGKKLRMNNF